MTVKQIIETDTTLRFFYDQKIDYRMLDWHVQVKITTALIAIYKWIDKH